MDDLIAALIILRKYGNPSSPTHCEHDILYVNVPYKDVSKEDRRLLKELGFKKNPDDDGFMSFRFGSA